MGTLCRSNGAMRFSVRSFGYALFNLQRKKDENDKTIEGVLKGILDVLDDTYFVFAESGDCCFYTGNGTTFGKWTVTETGVTSGTNVWVAEGNQLVCERDGFLLYWEKVSDSQAFP